MNTIDNYIDVYKKAQLIARCSYSTEVAEGFTLAELTVYQLSGQAGSKHKYALLSKSQIESNANAIYSEHNLV
jgi:hypothetical protein